MLAALKAYGKNSDSSASDSSDGESEAAVASEKKVEEELPDYLKPIDPERSLASRMQIVAAPDVIVNVII